MTLPDHARADILEFLGATPVADAQLSSMIDMFSARPTIEKAAVVAEAR